MYVEKRKEDSRVEKSQKQARAALREQRRMRQAWKFRTEKFTPDKILLWEAK